MLAVLRAEGVRVVIFTNDLEPAHVHVLGDGEAKVNLRGCAGIPELVWVDGMTRSEVRRAVRVVAENQGLLLAWWERIHG